MRLQPGRDWRFWAAIAVALLTIVAGIGFLVTLDSRHDKETQVEDLRGEVADLKAGDEDDRVAVECRARVAFETDRTSAALAIVTARALAAVGRGESPAPYGDELDAAADAYETAIAARDATLDALERGDVPDTCQEASP